MSEEEMKRIAENLIMERSIILICDNCGERFIYDFDRGITVRAYLQFNFQFDCPHCKSKIEFSFGELFEDGSVLIDIHGAKRGLSIAIGGPE